MLEFAAFRISLASPHIIREESCGEVTKPQTFDSRTGRPVAGGLFCERIFGPQAGWNSARGRNRFGSIELAAPVVHTWFRRAEPSPLAVLLRGNMHCGRWYDPILKRTDVESVVLYEKYLVTREGDGGPLRGDSLTEERYQEYCKLYGEEAFDVIMGAEAIRKWLVDLDLAQLSVDLRSQLLEASSRRYKKDLTTRLEIIESIRDSGNKPDWMVLDVIPVIPRAFRSSVPADVVSPSGHDLNSLYSKIIERNERVKRLLSRIAPDAEIRNEKRLLQKAVDHLFEDTAWESLFDGEKQRAGGSVARRSSLARRVADVTRNVVVTIHDCGTTQGITKGVIDRGEKVEVRLADAIKGRVSRQPILERIPDEIIVRESEMITAEIARKIEQLGISKIQVRSPMTCEAPLGVCALCYGMDLSTGALVEKGTEVGTAVAAAIDVGNKLTARRKPYIDYPRLPQSEFRAEHQGVLRFTRMKVVRNDADMRIALTGSGEIAVLDGKGRELEKHEIPIGSQILVKDEKVVPVGTVLCTWDPYSIPILAEVGGKVRYEDVVEGETVRVEKGRGGYVRRLIIDHRDEVCPKIVLEDAVGRPLDVYHLPKGSHIEVTEGATVSAGSVLARMPGKILVASTITSGLSRLREIFEARKPKDPAVMAEIDGMVEILGEIRRGKRTIVIRSETGMEREHLVPHGKRFLVHSGDVVQAGSLLVDGPLVPHDILRVSGEEAMQQYLVHEVQRVYRSHRVEINDKHIEIIIARMLRNMKVVSAGDTKLRPRLIVDRFDIRRVNQELVKCVKITEKGDSDFEEGAIVRKEALEQVNAKIETLGGAPAKGVRPKLATASTQFQGISKVAVESSGFLFASGFREAINVLAKAALAGKRYYLVKSSADAIRGSVILAGFGFHAHTEPIAEVEQC